MEAFDAVALHPICKVNFILQFDEEGNMPADTEHSLIAICHSRFAA
jgi:hypothetical protein